ncbi:MAG: hypothetical protein ABIY48_12675 [Acidimicrobiales bacterium]
MAAPLPSRTARTPPGSLRIATGLVSLETLVESIVVLGRTELTPGLRGLLVLCLALKWLFAWRILHLSHGAALGLLMLEGTTIVAAFGSVGTDGLVRLALGGTALLVMVLIASSLHAFPAPVLPSP